MASYVTLEQAETYFATKLYTSRWSNAPRVDRTNALAAATTDIDTLAYRGVKHSVYVASGGTTPTKETMIAGESQTNQFPRNDDTEVPQDIRDACCEIAYRYICGKNPDTAFEALGTAAQSYAGAKVTFDLGRAVDHIRAGILSVRAWRLLRPYLADVTTLTLQRVN